MSRSAIVRKLRPPALTPVQITRPFQREAPSNFGFVLAIAEDANIVAPGDGVVASIRRTRPGWNSSLVANRNSLCLCLDHGEGIKTYIHGIKNLKMIPSTVTRGDVLGTSTGEVFFAVEVDRTLINPALVNPFFVPRDGQIYFEQPNFIAQAPITVRSLISNVRVAVENTLSYFIRPGGGFILFNVDFNGNGSKTGLAATGVSDTDHWNVYDPVDFYITGYTCGYYGVGTGARYFNQALLVPLRTYLNAPSKVFLERVVPLTSFASAGASWDAMLASWVGGYSGPTPFVNAFNLRGLPRGNYGLYLYAEQGTTPLTSIFQVTVDGSAQTATLNPTGVSSFVENDNYAYFELNLSARSAVEIVANGYLSGLQIVGCGSGAYTPPTPPTPPAPPSSYAIEGTITESSVGFSAALEIEGIGTIFSAASGSYSQGVAAGYSGTVIPHYSGGTFSPAQRVYTSVGTNYTSQDYAFYATTTPPAPLSVVWQAPEVGEAGQGLVSYEFTDSGWTVFTSHAYEE
jgi:hypothetical protein